MQEELEVPYEVKEYQRTSDQTAPPELKAVNPLGTAPVITDGSLNLAESGAIVGTLYAVFLDMSLSVYCASNERALFSQPVSRRPSVPRRVSTYCKC